jgi:hypothetical protein
MLSPLNAPRSEFLEHNHGDRSWSSANGGNTSQSAFSPLTQKFWENKSCQTFILDRSHAIKFTLPDYYSFILTKQPKISLSSRNTMTATSVSRSAKPLSIPSRNSQSAYCSFPTSNNFAQHKVYDYYDSYSSNT